VAHGPRKKPLRFGSQSESHYISVRPRLGLWLAGNQVYPRSLDVLANTSLIITNLQDYGYTAVSLIMDRD